MSTLNSTLAANDARTNFYKLLDEVSNNLRRFVITHRGKTKAVVMPIEDVEAWEETMVILSDKKIMADLKEAEKDIKSGNLFSLSDIMKELEINEHKTDRKSSKRS